MYIYGRDKQSNLIVANVAGVQMAYKTEPRLHLYDDVRTQSWHILCAGTEAVCSSSNTSRTVQLCGKSRLLCSCDAIILPVFF